MRDREAGHDLRLGHRELADQRAGVGKVPPPGADCTRQGRFAGLNDVAAVIIALTGRAAVQELPERLNRRAEHGDALTPQPLVHFAELAASEIERVSARPVEQGEQCLRQSRTETQ